MAPPVTSQNCRAEGTFRLRDVHALSFSPDLWDELLFTRAMPLKYIVIVFKKMMLYRQAGIWQPNYLSRIPVRVKGEMKLCFWKATGLGRVLQPRDSGGGRTWVRTGSCGSGLRAEMRSGGCVPVPWVARCSSRGTQGHRAGCLPHYFFEPVHVFDPDCKNPTAVGFLLFSSIKFRIPE